MRRDRAADRPFRPRPKQLDELPSLYVPSRGGAGFVLAKGDDRTGDPTRDPAGTDGAATEDAAALLRVDEGREPDPEVHAFTREILGRLAIARPRRDTLAAPGLGELVSSPFRGVADEIDMDRTVDVLAQRRPLRPEEVVVRERRRRPRAVVLAVDISGSMRGERVKVAAATVGALAAELGGAELAVLTFWSDAAWLTRFGEVDQPLQLVDRMLGIPAQGLTNVGFPLDVAVDELGRARERDARVVLLSDCVHNAGPDPCAMAARLPRLDVLLDVSGESDPDLARDLGRIGRGRTLPVRSHHDVAAALNAVFAPHAALAARRRRPGAE